MMETWYEYSSAVLLQISLAPPRHQLYLEVITEVPHDCFGRNVVNVWYKLPNRLYAPNH